MKAMRALFIGLVGVLIAAEVIIAQAPTIGDASVTIDEQLHLGAASHVFKEGELFLWADSTSTAIGGEALSSSTTGSWNTALGETALQSNTEGYRNTAVGAVALKSNLTGSWNTAVGVDALQNNTGGQSNTAVGFEAMLFNEGDAVGYGSSNTAIGDQTLRANTSGYLNTAIGGGAMFYNQTGAFNTALGHGALSRSLGNYNTGVGFHALLFATGNSNTALGGNAGSGITTGSNNILIGANGFPTDGTTDDNEVIRIGNGFVHDKTFINGIWGVTTGGEGVAVLIDNSGQLGTVSSSRRVKEDISEMGSASARLLGLRPVTFRYKKPFDGGAKPIQFGLIAEDVARVFPELVVLDDQGRPETIKYHLLSTLLLNELQKQAEELQDLKARLAVVEARPSPFQSP